MCGYARVAGRLTRNLATRAREVLADVCCGLLLAVSGTLPETNEERTEVSDSNLSKDVSEPDMKTDGDGKWNPNQKSGKGSMADRPLPVPVEDESYYMKVSRAEAENLLKGQPDGTFILRPSSQSSHAYTLSVSCAGAVHNVGVRQRADGRLALGFPRRGERTFPSVAALVRHHRRRRLLLLASTGVLGGTTLKDAPQYYQTPSDIPVQSPPV